MAEAYVGEIRLLAFNYAPEGWLLCQGQELNTSQYQALFALIGNAYGGDGNSTFKLPDLRGRVPTQAGQGPLSAYQWAQSGGTTVTTINTASSFTLSSVNQLPAHSHTASFTPTGGGTPVQPTIAVKVSNDPGTSSAPVSGGYIAKSASTAPAQPTMYASTASSTTTLNAATAVATGGSGGITGGSVGIGTTGALQPSPVEVPITVTVPPAMPPFVAMNYAICVNGYFPPRP